MALTVRQFKNSFPDFKNTDDALIRAKLDEALKRIEPTVWEDLADDGQGYLAAHLLTLSSNGEKARLSKDEQTTMYQLEWNRLKMEVTFGLRTI